MKNIKVINISKEKKLDKKLYTVKNVPMETVKEICKNKHYLHRVPHIVASYGLYKNDLLLGIITFGIPPSPYLMKICGEEYKSNVLELNRLWCYDESPRNSESYLISQGIKLLKKDKPDIKIFVGESITGNDCVEQAKQFNEAIGIDAIVLAKADVDEKGGAAVSVSYITEKPIIYLGVGQDYDDLRKFDPNLILDNIGLA